MALGNGSWSQTWEVCDRHFIQHHSSSSPATAHYPCPQPWPWPFREGCLCKGSHQPPNAPHAGRPPWTLSWPREVISTFLHTSEAAGPVPFVRSYLTWGSKPQGSSHSCLQSHG